MQDQTAISVTTQSQEQLLPSEQQWSAPIADVSAAPSHSMNSKNGGEHAEEVVISSESASTGRTANLAVPAQTMEPTLLDERSLLACIVRAIPAGAGGRIRISTTVSIFQFISCTNRSACSGVDLFP